MPHRNLARSNAVLFVSGISKWTVDLATQFIRRGFEITWINEVEAVPKVLSATFTVATVVITAHRLSVADLTVLRWCRSRVPSIVLVVATNGRPTLESQHAILASGAVHVRWPANADEVASTLRRARSWRLN